MQTSHAVMVRRHYVNLGASTLVPSPTVLSSDSTGASYLIAPYSSTSSGFFCLRANLNSNLHTSYLKLYEANSGKEKHNNLSKST